jgi:two-component system, chemotaxis family, protein-glutamate methylesterase/glutaminase
VTCPSEAADEASPASGERVTQREIVVIGASAGGVEALTTLFAGLPRELAAAVFVVLHVMPGGASVLPKILTRSGALRVESAHDGEPFERGRAYVAPADYHMLLEEGHVRLTRGPRENGHRPAVDQLFRSAARAYGRRVVGVVLSGALDDGTDGLRMIEEGGGMALVQDPATALFPSMPTSALEHAQQARAVPIGELAGAICDAIDGPIEDDPQLPASPTSGKAEPVPIRERSDDDPRSGELTAITRPECGGSLWEHDERGILRFKCHVGHAYSQESLEASHSQALEASLWAALRSLEERADLFRRLARRMPSTRREEKARHAAQHAAVLRPIVSSFEGGAEDAVELGARQS